MKLGRRKKRTEAIVELNITAFLNLMVILVPFLLITAVFSRMTVLELNLPALDAKSKDEKQQEIKLQLQVLIRADALVVRDANLGNLKTIPLVKDDKPVEDWQRYVWKPLQDILLEIKSRFPKEQGIALLLDRDVNYKTMIQVMDHVRFADVVQVGTLETVSLFPQVSIGDLPQEEPEVTEGAE